MHEENDQKKNPKEQLLMCVGRRAASHLGYAGEDDQAQSGAVEPMLIWGETKKDI